MEVSENARFAVALEFEENGGLSDADVEHSVLDSIGSGVIRDEIAHDFAPSSRDDLLIELADHSDFCEELPYGVADVSAEFWGQRGVGVATPFFDDTLADGFCHGVDAKPLE